MLYYSNSTDFNTIIGLALKGKYITLCYSQNLTLDNWAGLLPYKLEELANYIGLARKVVISTLRALPYGEREGTPLTIKRGY